jgi:UDP-N-acetylmuramoyl-tripeptide--D-alanyl-D-alanine ligase
VSNALAVLAVVEAAGGDLAQAGLALAEMSGLPGRGARRPIRTFDGGEALLIDEAYNANPASMEATLKQLGQERGSRRIAILGAMKELGHQSAALHAGLARSIIDAKVDFALLVGEEMAPLADALAGKVPVERTGDANEAFEIAYKNISSGDAVLVKGSNSIGLGRLVERLAGSEVA